jgi:DNA repair exonuclease SbcCD ATPase subunit
VSELRARHSATLESCQTRVNELAAQIEQNVEPDDRVEQVERRLAEHAVAEKAIAALEGEAKGVERQLDDKRDQLEELRRRLRKSKRVRRQAQIAASVRELCHPSGLPKVVARANLRRMEGAINEGLGQFGDPFWVETDDNLSFVVHKPGEPPQPARRLSTGQRVVLALSFWPAVASLWSQDLGMLALDEPTANLDEDNRRFLAEALGRMTARVRGRRQLLMVSHDQSLRPAFDQVIDLGAKP